MRVVSCVAVGLRTLRGESAEAPRYSLGIGMMSRRREETPSKPQPYIYYLCSDADDQDYFNTTWSIAVTSFTATRFANSSATFIVPVSVPPTHFSGSGVLPVSSGRRSGRRPISSVGLSRWGNPSLLHLPVPVIEFSLSLW